jgi:hypothetical protein
MVDNLRLKIYISSRALVMLETGYYAGRVNGANTNTTQRK